MSIRDQLLQFVETIRPTLEHHPDVIFIKDLDLRFVYVNEAYRLLDPDLDVIGKTSRELFPDDSSLFDSTDQQLIDEASSVEYEIKVETDNATYHGLVIKTPIFNDKGEVIGIYGTSRDASDIVEVRDMIETIINTIPYPMLIKNTDLQYIKVNQAYLDEMGLPQEEIIGKSDLDLFGEQNSEFFRSKDRQVLQTGERVIYISRGEKSEKQYMTIKEPLYDGEGNIIGVVGIVNTYLDISDLQREVLNQQKIESLSALAGGIAHDLNNMLTSIVGLSSILIEDITDPEHNKMIKTMYQSSQNAASLIQKLLTFSKQTQREFGEVDLPSIISHIVDLVASSYSPSLTIETDYCKESLIIRADRTQISQMIMNLIINGVEAMDHSGTLRITMECLDFIPADTDFFFISDKAQRGKHVKISIADQGHGIDSNLLGKIFDPFFTTKDGGSGLGLSIVYGTLTAHNGLIRLDNSPEGATFEVFLPIS